MQYRAKYDRLPYQDEIPEIIGAIRAGGGDPDRYFSKREEADDPVNAPESGSPVPVV
jgi:hypothetical protein